MKFLDNQIQKTKKQYLDSRQTKMTRISTDLQEVHKIMVQNIEDVLQRGDALTGMLSLLKFAVIGKKKGLKIITFFYKSSR